jgi:hypothetical protein
MQSPDMTAQVKSSVHQDFSINQSKEEINSKTKHSLKQHQLDRPDVFGPFTSFHGLHYKP